MWILVVLTCTFFACVALGQEESNQAVDLIASLDAAKETPEGYHALCAAAYALLADETDEPNQARLETYRDEHLKKSNVEIAMYMEPLFREMLEEKRITLSDLKNMAQECEL